VVCTSSCGVNVAPSWRGICVSTPPSGSTVYSCCCTFSRPPKSQPLAAGCELRPWQTLLPVALLTSCCCRSDSACSCKVVLQNACRADATWGGAADPAPINSKAAAAAWQARPANSSAGCQQTAVRHAWHQPWLRCKAVDQAVSYAAVLEPNPSLDIACSPAFGTNIIYEASVLQQTNVTKAVVCRSAVCSSPAPTAFRDRQETLETPKGSGSVQSRV